MRATSGVRTGCDTRLIVVVILSACGRIDFDPITSTPTSDAPTAISDSMRPIDAAVMTSCSFAVPIQVGVRLAVNTCTGRDLLDGCGPAGREEVVIDFEPPTSGGYTVRAFNAGTMTVSTSTGRVDVPCGAATGCSGLLGTTFTAGQHYYFAYEAMATTCAAIEVLID